MAGKNESFYRKFLGKKSFIFTCHKCPIQLRVAKMPALDLPFAAGLRVAKIPDSFTCGENKFFFVRFLCD